MNNIIYILAKIKTEHMHKLTIWERDFISEVADALDGLGDYLTPQQANEYLTERQMNKLSEIYNKVM